MKSRNLTPNPFPSGKGDRRKWGLVASYPPSPLSSFGKGESDTNAVVGVWERRDRIRLEEVVTRRERWHKRGRRRVSWVCLSVRNIWLASRVASGRWNTGTPRVCPSGSYGWADTRRFHFVVLGGFLCLLIYSEMSSIDMGLVGCPGVVGKAAADEMLATVWDCSSRPVPYSSRGARYLAGTSAGATEKCSRLGSSSVFGDASSPKSVTFEQVGNAAVCGAVDNLLGRGNWQPPERWGSLLVTFPESTERWEVPCSNWHLDFPASQSPSGPAGVRIFTCLAKLPAVRRRYGIRRRVSSVGGEGCARGGGSSIRERADAVDSRLSVGEGVMLEG